MNEPRNRTRRWLALSLVLCASCTSAAWERSDESSEALEDPNRVSAMVTGVSGACARVGWTKVDGGPTFTVTSDYSVRHVLEQGKSPIDCKVSATLGVPRGKWISQVKVAVETQYLISTNASAQMGARWSLDGRVIRDKNQTLAPGADDAGDIDEVTTVPNKEEMCARSKPRALEIPFQFSIAGAVNGPRSEWAFRGVTLTTEMGECASP